MKKVFGGDGKPHRHPFGMPPVRVAAPSVHIVQSTRVLLAAAPTTPPCFRHWRRSSSLPSRGGLGKEVRLYEMPRAPLLGGLSPQATGGLPPASSPGASPHQKAPPSLKGAMGALYHITMGSAYSALGASGAFASSAFAAGSAGAAAGFGACFITGLGGFGSSFSGKRMMCLGHFWAHMPQPLHLS